MLDPIAAVVTASPYPYYRALAIERPIERDERLEVWVAASADAVRAALSSPHLAVRPPEAQVPAALRDGAAGRLWASWARMSDGARHTRSRGLVEALIREVDGALGSAAERAARELVAPGCDLDGFVDRLPPRAIAIALGIATPAAAMEATLELVRGCAANATPTQVVRAHEAAAALMQLLSEPDGQRCAAAISLLFQASDATSGLLGNTLVHLARNPPLREAALADPSLLDQVVAHVLATDPPVHNTRRFALRDTEILGARISAGQAVLVLLVNSPFGAAAHRCPADRLAAVVARAGASAALALRLEWHALTTPHYRPLPNLRIPRFSPRGDL